MSYPVIYTDVEDLVKEWILETPVADLIEINGYVQVYLAMPKGTPVPSLILSRIGGAPNSGSDVPEDIARIRFNCWGKNRPQSKQIANTLIASVETLGQTGGYVSSLGRLEVGETLSHLWLPDGEIARYVVDVLFTAVTP